MSQSCMLVMPWPDPDKVSLGPIQKLEIVKNWIIPTSEIWTHLAIGSDFCLDMGRKFFFQITDKFCLLKCKQAANIPTRYKKFTRRLHEKFKYKTRSSSVYNNTRKLVGNFWKEQNFLENFNYVCSENSSSTYYVI